MRKVPGVAAAFFSALLMAAPACDRGSSSGKPGEGPALEDPAFSKAWVVLDRVGSGNRIDAVVEGPSGYLAITHLPSLDPRAMPARNNIAAVSVDGVNWVEQLIAPDAHYFSVAAGAGRYVAVGGMAPGGGAGIVVTSTDGRNWSQAARVEAGPAYGSVLSRVRYTPAGFVAVGMAHLALTSSDGIAWRQSALVGSPPAESFRDAAFGAGRFAVVGNFNMYGSADGQSWSLISCGPQLPCSSVTAPDGVSRDILGLSWVLYGNGTFLTSGLPGLLRSSDGERWTWVGMSRNSQVIVAGGLFVDLTSVNHPLNTSFTVSTSRDGTLWTARTTASSERTDLTCATKRCLVFPEAIVLVP